MANDRGPLNSADPTTSFLVGGVYNAQSPAPQDEQPCALQLDSEGNLLVNVAVGGGGGSGTVKIEDSSGNALNSNGSGALQVAVVSGGGSNPSVGLTGAAAPTSATEIGIIDGSGKLQGASSSNPVPVSGTVSIGSGPFVVTGNLTNNNAAPSTTNIGALTILANAVAPTWNEGDLVLGSADLAGNLRVLLQAETTKVIGTVRAIGNIGGVFDAVLGAAIPANAIQVGGSDGTDLRALLTSGTGQLHVLADSGSTTAIGDGITGPVEVQPGIGTATVPPTFTTAGADNSDPALTVSMSPNSGIPAIIQKISGTGSGSQTSLATSNFASSVTAGNSIVVVVGVGNSGAIGITDTLGNSYTQALKQANGGAFEVAVFYATNIKGGTNAVTITVSSPVSLNIAAYEVSGIIGVGGGGSATTTSSTVNQQGTVDASASATGTSATPASGTATVFFPNEIAFGGIAIGTADQTPSAFIPWNKDFDLVVGGSPVGLFGLHTFSQPLGAGSTAVSLTATITSEPWAAMIVTFKPALHAVGGNVSVQGMAASGSAAPVGNPVLIGGTNVSGTVSPIGISTGGQITTVRGTALADAATNTIGLLYDNNVGSQYSLSVNPSLFNGTTWDRARSAGVGNAVAATGIAAAATYVQYNTTLPAPTAGQYTVAQCDTTGSTYINTEGRKATYSAFASFTAVAGDIAVLPGSASKTIRIIRVEVSFTTSGVAAVEGVQLIKRSAADTGGTSAAMTAVPHDSAFAGASAAPLNYTVAPTPGAAVGAIRGVQFNDASSSVPGANTWIWDFGARPSSAIVLRGVAQMLCVNIPTAIATQTALVSFEWTEE